MVHAGEKVHFAAIIRTRVAIPRIIGACQGANAVAARRGCGVAVRRRLAVGRHQTGFTDRALAARPATIDTAFVTIADAVITRGRLANPVLAVPTETIVVVQAGLAGFAGCTALSTAVLVGFAVILHPVEAAGALTAHASFTAREVEVG